MTIKENLNNAIDILKSGGVIVYPTDTIYGIGCNALNPEAVEKIRQIKKRSPQKAMSLMFSSVDAISKYAHIPKSILPTLKKLLPGSYTFILKAKKTLPDDLLQNKTIGVRIPDNKICLALTSGLDKPIITTSVNISGEESLNDPKKIKKQLDEKFDLIIDNGIIKGTASTVVDLTKEKPVVLRQGARDWYKK